MAYLGTNGIEEERFTSSSNPNFKPTLPTYGGGGGGIVGGGGGNVGAGIGGGAGSGAPSTTPQAGGGSFTNLQQYLMANQDTGATTGRAAQNVVDQQGNRTTADLSAYGKSAGSQISDAAKGVAPNQTILGNIAKGGAQVDQALMDKIKTGGDPNTGTYKATDYTVPAYKGPAYNDVQTSWKGPNNTAGFTGTAAADQTKAIQDLGSLKGYVENAQGGQNGISSLLGNAYQGPGYSAGEKGLDAFLAGGTAGGKAALARSAPLGKSIETNAKDINTGLQKSIDAGKSSVASTNKGYQDAITKATGLTASTKAAYDAAAAKAAADAKAAYDANQKPGAAIGNGPGGGIPADQIPRAGTLVIRPPEGGAYIDPNQKLDTNVQATEEHERYYYPGGGFYAHGGRVQPYSKLQNMLRGK